MEVLSELDLTMSLSEFIRGAHPQHMPWQIVTDSADDSRANHMGFIDEGILELATLRPGASFEPSARVLVIKAPHRCHLPSSALPESRSTVDRRQPEVGL